MINLSFYKLRAGLDILDNYRDISVTTHMNTLLIGPLELRDMDDKDFDKLSDLGWDYLSNYWMFHVDSLNATYEANERFIDLFTHNKVDK